MLKQAAICSTNNICDWIEALQHFELLAITSTMEMKEKVHAVDEVFCGRNDVDVASISIIIGKKLIALTSNLWGHKK